MQAQFLLFTKILSTYVNASCLFEKKKNWQKMGFMLKSASVAVIYHHMCFQTSECMRKILNGCHYALFLFVVQYIH